MSRKTIATTISQCFNPILNTRCSNCHICEFQEKSLLFHIFLSRMWSFCQQKISKFAHTLWQLQKLHDNLVLSYSMHFLSIKKISILVIKLCKKDFMEFIHQLKATMHSPVEQIKSYTQFWCRPILLQKSWEISVCINHAVKAWLSKVDAKTSRLMHWMSAEHLKRHINIYFSLYTALPVIVKRC